jgi:Flp pilus assembly protein TadG
MKRVGTGNSTLRRRRTNNGSVIVETALIFLIFAGLMIGAFDFGQFLFIHQALVERARYAARWGAINDATDSTSITNMVLYNQAATPASGTASYFNLTAGTTDAQGHQSGNVFVSNPGSGTDNYRLTIQISGYSYSVLSPYITGSYTGPPVTVSVPLGLYN